jgi:ethanolamine-phosphate cytidylyltransferase
VTTRDIIQRIVDNRAAFEARNAKKVVSEAAYYGNKGQTGYVQEI